MPIDKKFWKGDRWDGHAAFNTVEHTHVSCYSPSDGKPCCEVLVVECQDGRWYVEDNWGGDAGGAAGVWNPRSADNTGPQFFQSEDDATQLAVAVVASVCGVSESKVSIG
jgi:hypothetical protein